MIREEFIEKAKKVHGDKYDYSKVDYKGNKEKVCIICPIHGEFWQVASTHINLKCGCPLCANKGSGKRNELTKEEFLEKSRKAHGDKYDYSKVEYKNNREKVCIICPEHGEFWQIPLKHMKGQGCAKCSHRSYAYTNDEFIERARKTHGDKYDYSKVEYKNGRKKVCIICPVHGEFWQLPNDHIRGSGCPKCQKSYKLNTETFIQRAKDVHGDKYDYSKVEYKNNSTKVCIICPVHGEFWQNPNNHLSKNGCPTCHRDKERQMNEFIERSKKIHCNKYDYSKVEYVNSTTKVCIICPEHGEFWQMPASHLRGYGCHECSELRNISETRLYDNLKENTSFEIERQKKFEWLKSKSLDIFIKDLNVAIEYQGKQHFKPIEYFGGGIKFKSQKQRDIDKYNACKEHGIKLLYFSYDKNVPSDYIDKVYTDENELLEIINNLKTQILK